jgi:hypothetical protein
MDGINPTLAFAALFFGLSSNAHHATPPAQIELQSAIDCPAWVISGDPALSPTQQTLAEAFEIDLAGVTEAEAKSSETTASGPIKPDPIARHMVPVASNLPALDSEPDPCAPDR